MNFVDLHHKFDFQLSGDIEKATNQLKQLTAELSSAVQYELVIEVILCLQSLVSIDNETKSIDTGFFQKTLEETDVIISENEAQIERQKETLEASNEITREIQSKQFTLESEERVSQDMLFKLSVDIEDGEHNIKNNVQIHKEIVDDTIPRLMLEINGLEEKLNSLSAEGGEPDNVQLVVREKKKQSTNVSDTRGHFSKYKMRTQSMTLFL